MNRYAPQHSRVFREMIIVSTPEKPFTFTGKGTPRRQAIINEYADEINATYDAVGEIVPPDAPFPPSWTDESTLNFVRDIVQRVMGVPIRDDDDIFRNGCDRYVASGHACHGFERSLEE